MKWTPARVGLAAVVVVAGLYGRRAHGDGPALRAGVRNR